MRVRNFRIKDLQTFLSYRNDPEVARYQTWKMPLTEQEAREFLQEHMVIEIGTKGKWHQLAIEFKETYEHIGDCAIHTSSDGKQAEFGITIASNHQKKGYAYEALRGLFEYLFRELKFHRITALVDTSNTSSLMLMKKLNMRQEAYYKESYYTGSTWTDEVQFGILQKEFIID